MALKLKCSDLNTKFEVVCMNLVAHQTVKLKIVWITTIVLFTVLTNSDKMQSTVLCYEIWRFLL
jgi:hypothetical protein